MEKHYTVQQAAETTGLKPYVLRYWEEELNLSIGRNELGHRYYTGYDIQMFLNIRELKNRGLKLSAIRELIPKIAQNVPGGARSKIRLLETGQQDEKEDQEIFKNEVEDIKRELEQESVEENWKIVEFQKILERLIQQELQIKRAGEGRCRSIDAAIRRQQLARREAAAASEKKEKKRGKIHR
ncbi:MAG: MerR family transcriptional regulator [Eubacteriales bacterium]|nr:MerR family transcriptional regulator [Eubacteriales bacterium]